MDMQGALRARLIADTAVSAIVSDRVSWVERPQGRPLPALTLQVISDDRPQHLKGFFGARSTRVQADCWATNYGEALQLARAVIAAAVPAGDFSGVEFGRAMIEAQRDMGENVNGEYIHRQSLDLIIWHEGE